MILVAFSHGLRASEVIGFKRDAVKDGYLTIKRLKGSNRTTQPLIEDADPLFDERSALERFIAQSKPNEPVFNVSRSTFWRSMQKHAAAAGIPAHKRHPHVLKHTIAQQTIHSAGIEHVREYLGHKSMSSTGEYLKKSQAESSLAIRAAMKG